MLFSCDLEQGRCRAAYNVSFSTRSEAGHSNQAWNEQVSRASNNIPMYWSNIKTHNTRAVSPHTLSSSMVLDIDCAV
jgi:hypothetical protein